MHIALVEDDSDQRDLMELWLGSGQHTSHGFGTAAEFIDGLKKERFDLLLIDWMLPDGTGGDVLQWVRQNLGWEIAVIVVTARDDEATVVSAHQSLCRHQWRAYPPAGRLSGCDAQAPSR